MATKIDIYPVISDYALLERIFSDRILINIDGKTVGSVFCTLTEHGADFKIEDMAKIKISNSYDNLDIYEILADYIRNGIMDGDDELILVTINDMPICTVSDTNNPDEIHFEIKKLSI